MFGALAFRRDWPLSVSEPDPDQQGDHTGNRSQIAVPGAYRRVQHGLTLSHIGAFERAGLSAQRYFTACAAGGSNNLRISMNA